MFALAAPPLRVPAGAIVLPPKRPIKWRRKRKRRTCVTPTMKRPQAQTCRALAAQFAQIFAIENLATPTRSGQQEKRERERERERFRFKWPLVAGRCPFAGR